MHGECGHRYVGLAASVAFLRRLRIKRAMRLLVTREITRCGILFATLGALVAAAFLLHVRIRVCGIRTVVAGCVSFDWLLVATARFGAAIQYIKAQLGGGVIGLCIVHFINCHCVGGGASHFVRRRRLVDPQFQRGLIVRIGMTRLRRGGHINVYIG